MTRFASMLTVAASLTVATFAEAGEIALSQPIQAASLHDKGVDMVVYYTDETSHFEVVATYVTAPAAEPRRMRMGLTDGDSVRFALPGQPSTVYTFARAEETVTVTSEPASVRVALVAE
jgi:hypothetical protein